MQRRREFGTHNLGERYCTECVALQRIVGVRRQVEWPWRFPGCRRTPGAGRSRHRISAGRRRIDPGWRRTADSGRIATSPERSVRAISAARTTPASCHNPHRIAVQSRPVARSCAASTSRIRFDAAYAAWPWPPQTPNTDEQARIRHSGCSGHTSTSRRQARHFRGAHRGHVGPGELGAAGRSWRFPRCGSTMWRRCRRIRRRRPRPRPGR